MKDYLKRIESFVASVMLLLSPCIILFVDFYFDYRYFIFALLSLLIIFYFLVEIFFRISEKVPVSIRRVVRLSIVNVIFLSIIAYTGNLSSSFFFVLYFLVIYVALSEYSFLAIQETFLLLVYLFVFEVVQEGSLDHLFRNEGHRALVNALSLLLYSPLSIALANYFSTLRQKEVSLEQARNLLLEEELGEETLLEELNQGVIVTDSRLNIIKVSKWIERELGVSTRVLLEKGFQEAFQFYDPIRIFPIQKTDFFYRNLYSKSPQELKWQVVFKDRYGKSKTLTIIQKPIYYEHRKFVGFIIFINIPSKIDELSGYVGTFNQVLNFKLSSSLAIIKSSLTMIKERTKIEQSDLFDRYFKASTSSIRNMVELLEDSNLSTRIKEQNLELKITGVDINKLLDSIVQDYSYSNSIARFIVSSPYKQTDKISILADPILLTKGLERLFRGAVILSQGRKMDVLLLQDLVTKKPTLEVIFEGGVVEVVKDLGKLEVPFYDGDMGLLTKYEGSGLEISNASQLLKHMGFDFRIRYEVPNLIFKVVFL